MNDSTFSEGADVSRRGSFARLVITICLVAICGFADATCRAQSTPDIFSRLDKAAQSFKGATAAIQVTTHTGIINEDEIQVGTVVVRRYSRDEIQFQINFKGKGAQGMALREQTFQIYYPEANLVREYPVGKYRDLAQKLILLGFGMPGRELAANYEVNNLGAEQVQSQESIHLQLTPRAPDVLKQLSRVDLWISLKANCPIQQKFFMPSGDYRLATYSDIKINPHLSDTALDFPKEAKREFMK
jgi:outer membrane lipoprotein-sorting protein